METISYRAIHRFIVEHSLNESTIIEDGLTMTDIKIESGRHGYYGLFSD